LSLVLENKKKKKKTKRKQKYAFLCNFDADSRKQGAKRRNDLRVVTELRGPLTTKTRKMAKKKGRDCAERGPTTTK